MDKAKDFFDNIKNCSLSNLEIYNKVEELTSNFQLRKLEILFEDFTWYLHSERTKREAACTTKEIERALNEFELSGEVIPYKIGKIDREEYDEQINELDLEKLCFPNEFLCCREFENLLRKEIKRKVSDHSSSLQVKDTAGTFEYPYPEIFTSSRGYRIFSSFIEQIPFKDNPNSEYADFSFLFFKLKEDRFIHDLKHKTFLDFLYKKLQFEFAQNHIQFKKGTTSQKVKAYSACKQQFT